MNVSLYPRHGRGRITLRVVGWLLLVGLGIGLTWYGFAWTEEDDQITGTPSPVPMSAQATARPTATALPSPTLPSAPTPADTPAPSRTDTPSSTTTPEPAAIPATPTTEAEPPSTGDEAWPTEVFRLINQVRAEHGLPPYTYDETPPNDPHRSTLLSTWVTEIGIAVVPTDRGDYYFIADFGRPRRS
jgi:hypothetical protein